MQIKIKIILLSLSLILINKVHGQGNYKGAMDEANKCFLAQNWDCAITNYSLAKEIAIDRRMNEESRNSAEKGLTKALAAKYSPQLTNDIRSDNKLTFDNNNKIPQQRSTQFSHLKNPIRLDFPSNYYTNSNQDINSLVENIKKLTSNFKEKNSNIWLDVRSDIFFNNEESRLQGVNRKNEAKFLYDSTLDVINHLDDIPEFILNIHLRSALYYGWDLLDKTASDATLFERVKNVLQSSINISSKYKYNSAKGNYARAGFENLLRAFYIKINDGNNAYKHGLLAAEFITKATQDDPNNAYFWGSLYVYVRNLKFLPDTTISKIVKKNFAELSHNIAYCLENKPISNIPEFNSILLSVMLTNTNDKNEEYISDKKYLESLNLLKLAINKNENKLLSYNLECKPIFIASIYIRLANLYEQYIKDSTLNRLYTQKAADTIVYFLRNNSLTQYRWTGWFQSAIDDIIMKTEFVLNKNERQKLSESLVESIQNGNNDYFENQEISYAYSNANSLLASMLLNNKLKTDSTKALVYLKNSIEFFEKNNFLDTYSSFSEDYAKFCNPFAKIITLYSAQGDYYSAKKYYESMIRYFNPIIEKYRFDFYFMRFIISASESYGEFLFKTKRFKEAIVPLQFSSYEGIKQSTEYLIEIYSSSNLKNKELLDSFTSRNRIQSKNMKRFTIPIQCGNIKQPFHVYVMDRAKGHPYKGIQDQVQWVKEARGCEVPEDVISSFNKLQIIAWENNVSFQDLCVYALGAANKDSTKAKFVEKDSSQIFFDSKKNNVKDLVDKSKTSDLFNYIKYYYQENDRTRADSLLTEILRLDNSIETKYYLSLLYYIHGSDTKTGILFLQNKGVIKEFRDYFLKKDINNLRINEAMYAYYYNLVILDSAYYLQLSRSEKAKQDSAISSHFNSLAWYSLLIKQNSRVYEYLMQSKKFDPKSVYPNSNIPHFYLLSNQQEIAKAEYNRLKDKPFLPNSEKLKTYRDAFLEDFKDFEKAGLLNDNMKEIIRLLNDK